jgi:hypothetical protein
MADAGKDESHPNPQSTNKEGKMYDVLIDYVNKYEYNRLSKNQSAKVSDDRSLNNK